MHFRSHSIVIPYLLNLVPKSPIHNSSLDNISDFCSRIGSLALEDCIDSLFVVLVSFCILP